MNFPRLRLAVLSVLVAAFTSAAPIALAQAPLPGRETTADSVSAFALSEKMPVDRTSWSARCRTACATTSVRTRNPADPHRTAARREGGLRAGGCRPARAGPLRRAHGVRRHTPFSAAGASPSSWPSLGLGIGPDANAATSYDDTHYTLRVPGDSPEVLDRALLVLEDWGASRHIRSGRHRARARHRLVGMAAATGRRGAHAGQDPQRPARGIALRRP